MLARTRFSAAVLFLVALALLAAPPRGHAAGGLKITGPPGLWIVGIVGGKTVYPEYTFTNEEATPQAFRVIDPLPISLDGTSDMQIEFDRTTCGYHTDLVLQPGASCTVTLRFHPQLLGRFADHWTVFFGGQPQAIEIESEGARPPFKWESVRDHFGSHAMGTTATRTVTLVNRAHLEARVERLELHGDTQSFELLENDCAGHWLAPKATCTAKLRFRSRGTGDFFASLTAVAPGVHGTGDFRYSMDLVGSGHLAP
jgi:hypothetical protein